MKSAAIRYEPPASSTWSEKLVQKLTNSDYRHAYMAEGVKTWIARQVRVLREQRGWSQGDLGREAGKPQSAISRIEDPDYGKLSVKTLLELAATYDVALLIQFVEWDDWLRRMDDVSTPSLQKQGFDAEKLLARKIALIAQSTAVAIVRKPPAIGSILVNAADAPSNEVFGLAFAASTMQGVPITISDKIELSH